jgi:TRAP-type transport system periplasmic protein
MDEFARLAEEYTDGEVVINIAAGGVLGGERDVAEGIQLGTIDGAILGGILQNFDPAMAILEFPFLFKNTEHVNAVMQGEVGEQIKDRLVEQTGIRALGYIMRTPRQLTTLRRVESLEDIRGMQIRVPEMQAHLETWRALGVNPTPIAFTEVYNALQQGVVDGQENPIGVIYANAFGEVVNYLAWTDHLVGFMLITISDHPLPAAHARAAGRLVRAAEDARVYNDRAARGAQRRVGRAARRAGHLHRARHGAVARGRRRRPLRLLPVRGLPGALRGHRRGWREPLGP